MPLTRVAAETLSRGHEHDRCEWSDKKNRAVQMARLGALETCSAENVGEERVREREGKRGRGGGGVWEGRAQE